MPITHDILQHLLPTLPEQTWLARFIEVLPGVRDAQILAVTAQLERVLDFHWPDTLVGAYLSQIHLPDDTHRARQYGVLRMCGVSVVTDYPAHLRHPSGRILRIVKHVTIRDIHGIPCWITQHERMPSSVHMPAPPDPTPLLHQYPEAQRLLAAYSVAEVLRSPTTSSTLPPPLVLSCQKCGHSWYRRQVHDPRQCPHCKNPHWHQPRQRRSRKTSLLPSQE